MAGPGRRLADVIFYGAVLAVLVLLMLVARRGVGLAEGLEVLCAGLLLVGTVATVAWVAWRLWSRPRTPTARELASRFDDVRFMGGTKFEVFVADLFRAMGHQVLMSGGVGDQGVDIIVDPGSRRIAVQCKNHLRPVGNKPVQEVYAGARHYRCSEAWVVAPAGYTRGALELAESTHVSLHDAGSIRRWIGKVDALEKERANGTPPETVNTFARHPHHDDLPKG
jgi:HJR/Mrr/RecB family endonuclease